MGEPVRIDDMARNLIRLSGYTPDVYIMVEYTGLRDIIGTTKRNLDFSGVLVAWLNLIMVIFSNMIRCVGRLSRDRRKNKGLTLECLF